MVFMVLLMVYLIIFLEFQVRVGIFVVKLWYYGINSSIYVIVEGDEKELYVLKFFQEGEFYFDGRVREQYRIVNNELLNFLV